MRLLLVAAILSFPAAAQDPNDQYGAIERVTAQRIECAKPSTFEPLFKLSGSGLITGADPREELAEANENAFLKCPRDFLLALKDQPKSTRKDLVRLYFGVRHAPQDLGAELRKWQSDPQVGRFVRTHFERFLSAKAPE